MKGKRLCVEVVKRPAKHFLPFDPADVLTWDHAFSVGIEAGLGVEIFLLQSQHLHQGLLNERLPNPVLLQVRRQQSNLGGHRLGFLDSCLANLLGDTFLDSSPAFTFAFAEAFAFALARRPRRRGRYKPGSLFSISSSNSSTGHQSGSEQMASRYHSESSVISTIKFSTLLSYLLQSKTAATASGRTIQGLDLSSTFHLLTDPSTCVNSKHLAATMWVMLRPTVDSFGRLAFFQMEVTTASTACLWVCAERACLGTTTTTMLPCLEETNVETNVETINSLKSVYNNFNTQPQPSKLCGCANQSMTTQGSLENERKSGNKTI